MITHHLYHLFAFLLAQLQRLLETMLALACRRPRIVCTIFSLVTLLVAAGAIDLKIFISAEDTIGSKFQSVGELTNLKNEFHLGHQLQIIFHKKNDRPFTHYEVCQLFNIIQQEAFSNHDIEDIISPLALRKSELKNNFFTFPLLLHHVCEQNGVEVPRGTPLDLSPLQTTPWHFLVTDSRSQDLLFDFTFKNSKNRRFGEFDPTIVGALMARLSHKLAQTAPDISFIPSGYALFKYETLKGFNGQTALNGLMMVILFALMRLCFGTWLAGALVIFSLSIMAMLIYGIMGFCGFPIDILTIGLFLIVSISAVQDFLFVSFRMLKTGDSWQAAYRHYLLPSFLTSFTTIVGFGSLLSSELPTIQRFGGLAAFGALLEWLIIFCYFPSIFMFFPHFKSWVNHKRALDLKWVEKLSGFVPGPNLVRAMVLIFFLAPLTIFTLRVTDNPRNNFLADNPVNVGLDHLMQSRGWMTSHYLVFNDRFQEAKNRAIIAKFKELPGVKFVDDPYRFLDFFTEGLTPPYAVMAKTTLQSAPIYKHYFSLKNRALATLYLDTYSMDSVTLLLEMQKNLCPQDSCKILGPAISLHEFSQHVIPTLISSLAISLLIVSATLWGLCLIKKERYRLSVILSSLWGAVVVVLMLKIFNMYLNHVVCIFAAVLVGITGDNAIQYLFSTRDEEGGIELGIAEKGAGSTQIALIMSILTLTLLGSTFRQIRTLGILFVCGIILSLAGDLWLLKGMIALQKRGARGRQKIAKL